jgi:hypothetical protein
MIVSWQAVFEAAVALGPRGSEFAEAARLLAVAADRTSTHAERPK